MKFRAYTHKKSLAFVPALVFLGGLIIFVPQKAQAFQAGRITDDAVFYDRGRMHEGDIQRFLNSKVPHCDTNGSRPYGGTTRASYGTSRGYPPPYTCLKDKAFGTGNRPADSLCNGFNAGTKKAARIINEVSKSCGVNPQVLLVLLQKEQSLVTDDWPWSIQYKKATGYGCPDTADCNAQYAGFFNQVFEAAKAFKRYRKFPNSFNYRAQRNNNILFHPNRACGSSNVFIQNQATAGLYIYTPYQPNNALLGGGPNGCSSYGNYNFWNTFRRWFGNTLTTQQFAWKLKSQEAYSNPERTRKFTSKITVAPNEKIYMRVKALNWGSTTWGNVFTRLGTSRPIDRKSHFQDSSWITPARTTEVTPHAVGPGDDGTFEFTLKAPSKPGAYKEYFNLVADGYTWFPDLGLYYAIHVVEPASPSSTKNSLGANEELMAGEYIMSKDRQSVFVLQKDGNVVLYRNFRAVWASGTAGQAAHRLTLQGDGNLVLRNASNQAIWNSGTSGNADARLVLQTDSNTVLYASDNTPLWSTSTLHNPDLLGYVQPTLPARGKLHPGQQLETADRRYRLVLQHDGNIVLRSHTGRATWSSGTYGKAAARLDLQTDGNLVLRAENGRALWHTHTNGHGRRTHLTMQQDGNLVLYKNRKALWHTRTFGKE